MCTMAHVGEQKTISGNLFFLPCGSCGLNLSLRPPWLAPIPVEIPHYVFMSALRSTEKNVYEYMYVNVYIVV